MLSSPISIIGNELALILNKKFKTIIVEISPKKINVVEIALETTLEIADFVAKMDLDYFFQFSW